MVICRVYLIEGDRKMAVNVPKALKIMSVHDFFAYSLIMIVGFCIFDVPVNAG